MAFCEFSNEIVSNNTTQIDNIFLSDFLPNMEGDYLKIYLYGLYKCNSHKDNTLESFARDLNMSSEDIVSVFYYLQDMGLVNVIDIEDMVVKFLPTKNALYKIKKYNVDKYTAFNISAQEIIGNKMLTPREYEEFYYLIESLHIDKEALLKIINYCVKLKGENVSVSYISAVAKNWIYDGVRTSEDVDNKLLEQERVSGDVVSVLKAMGSKRQATVDEYQLYITWTKNMEVSLDVITHIVKKAKIKTFTKLNDMIQKLYSNRILSIKEIDEYIDSLDDMFKLAKIVVKNLGLWYDNLETVVDNYIACWKGLGFENEAIEKLSNYAFRSNIRTLEGLNNNINNMFKLGVLTADGVDGYLEDIVRNDNIIGNILLDLGINRSVTSSDRTLYKTWIYDWGMREDVVAYAVEQSKGKYLALQYLSRVLSEYHNANIMDIESAKKHKLSFIGVKENTQKVSPKKAQKREYSRSELDSLFDNITEIEI